MATGQVLVRYVGNGTGLPPGTLYYQIQIPNSTSPGNNHPHPIIIMVPSGVTRSATIVLHGGGGNNINILRNLSLVRSPGGGTFTASDITWTLMSTFGNMIVAAPQGWADPTTISSKNPNGVASWDNYFMNGRALAAGWNDVQMLLDLKTFLATNFGVQGCNIAGHSNGGMMVNRMLLEHPSTFTHYMVTSGPLPIYWSNTPATANSPRVPTPPTFPNKPYFAQYGAQDNIIGILYATNGFQGTTWPQQSPQLSVADVTYPYLSSWIGEWSNWQKRISDAGSSDTPAYTDGVVTNVAQGTQTTWINNGTKLQLQLLSNASHSIGTHKAASGRYVFADWMNFIVAN